MTSPGNGAAYSGSNFNNSDGDQHHWADALTRELAGPLFEKTRLLAAATIVRDEIRSMIGTYADDDVIRDLLPSVPSLGLMNGYLQASEDTYYTDLLDRFKTLAGVVNEIFSEPDTDRDPPFSREMALLVGHVTSYAVSLVGKNILDSAISAADVRMRQSLLASHAEMAEGTILRCNFIDHDPRLTTEMRRNQSTVLRDSLTSSAVLTLAEVVDAHRRLRTFFDGLIDETTETSRHFLAVVYPEDVINDSVLREQLFETFWPLFTDAITDTYAIHRHLILSSLLRAGVSAEVTHQLHDAFSEDILTIPLSTPIEDILKSSGH
jgi:hypothetical protein